jgi:hypothetical protein
MAIDLRRVVQAAIEAAVQDPTPVTKPKTRHLSSGRALLLGAGLVTAGRVIAASRGREMVGYVKQRIAESDWYHEQEPEHAVDYEDEPDEEADEWFEEEAEGEDGDEYGEPPEELDDAAEEDEEYESPDNGEEENEKPRPRRSRGRA